MWGGENIFQYDTLEEVKRVKKEKNVCLAMLSRQGHLPHEVSHQK